MEIDTSIISEVRPLVASAYDPQAALNALLDLVQPFGIHAVDVVSADRVFRRWGEPALKCGFLKANFPTGWDQRWPRYALVDPILPATAGALWEVDISQLRARGGHSALLEEFWTYLSDQGMAEGKAVPVHLPGGAYVALAFYGEAGSDAGHSDTVLFSVAQLFGRALAETFLKGAATLKDALSDRETECLYWASVGKTTEDIALILGKAPQTVRFHIENAGRKLGAANRIAAIAQACARGLISPN